jgi:hypothetical protein
MRRDRLLTGERLRLERDATGRWIGAYGVACRVYPSAVSIDMTSAGLVGPAAEAPDAPVNEPVMRPGRVRRYVPLLVLAGLVLLTAGVFAAVVLVAPSASAAGGCGGG